MLKFIPAVDKALNLQKRLRMGPRAEGAVGRLRNLKAEQKNEIDRLSKDVASLEMDNKALKAGLDPKMSVLRQELQ